MFIKEKLQLSPTQGNYCPHDMEDHCYRHLISFMNNIFIDHVLSNHPFHSAENRAQLRIHIRKQVQVKMAEDRATGSIVLHILAVLGHSDFFSVILSSDCPNINHKSKKGETPLDIACKNRHVRIVKCLVKGKAARNY